MLNKFSNKFFLAIVVVFSFSVSISACYYDVEQELYPKPLDSGINCDTTNATFSGKILPLINSKCNSCHSTAISSGGVSLEGYNNILIMKQNGKLMGTINHSAGFIAMPQGGAKLSDCDIANLNTWINSGAPNN